MLIDESINDRRKLSSEARTAFEATIGPLEPLRVIVRGAFGTAMVATDRRVLIWKKRRVFAYPWRNLAEVVFGGGFVVKWVQVRGPGVGLVRPSLLNIGELLDTIQIGESVTENVQAVLETMAAQRGLGQPLESEESSMENRTPPGHRTSPGGRPVVEANGAGARLAVFSDRVRIQHLGFRGFLHKVLPAEKEIALDQIVAVDFQPPGPLRLGHMRLRLRSTSTSEPADDGFENEVMFYLHQEGPFRTAKAEIERRLASPTERTKETRATVTGQRARKRK